MSGAIIAANLLREVEPLLEIVPAARIRAGAQEAGAPFPYITTLVTSTIERTQLSPDDKVTRTDRVSVQVAAQNYRQQGQIIRLIRTHLRHWRGEQGDARDIIILLAGAGPDMRGPTRSYDQTQDLRITFNEPA